MSEGDKDMILEYLDEYKMSSEEMDAGNKPFIEFENQEDIKAEPATNSKHIVFFEGDIEISPEEILREYDTGNIQKIMNIAVNKDAVHYQAAKSSSSKLWPGAVVPYNFHSSLSSLHRAMIQDAMNAWQDATCLKNYTNQLYIFASEGA